MSGDDKKLKIAFLEALGSIPAYLLSTKEGVGLISMLLGTAMKQANIQTFVDIIPTIPGIPGSGGGANQVFNFFERIEKTAPNEALLRAQMKEAGVPDTEIDRLIEEIKKINKEKGLGEEIVGGVPSEFGQIYISDLLIWGGFFSMTAEAIKGVGEIVPF